MRKIYWFLWICCMAAMVSACSNDDDEPGMEKPGDNGGSTTGGDEIWKEGVRRVRRLEGIEKDGYSFDLVNVDYMGKVVRGYVAYSWSFGFNLVIEDTFVEISLGGGTSVLDLVDGKIMNCGEFNLHDDDSVYCAYENGCLKQMIVKDANRGEARHDFVFASGNLSERKYRSEYESSEEKWTYSYSEEIRNDANIDLLVCLEEYLREYDFEFSSGKFWLGGFGFFGERSKNLPTHITHKSENDTEEWDISYELDEEGYPVRMILKEKDRKEPYILGIYYY